MSSDISLPSFLKEHIPALAALGAVASFVSDVVTPLAPVATYAAIGLTLLALVLFALNSIMRSRVVSGLAAISTAIALCNGALVLGQTLTGTTSAGISGSSIDAVAQLQTSLGIVHQDLSEIKQSVTAIESSTSRIAASSEKSAETLEQMATSFRESMNTGDLFVKPATYEQFYSNARKLSEKGEYAASVAAYRSAIKLSGKQIDPVFRFWQLVSTKEGPEAARTQLQAVRTDKNALAIDSVLATQFGGGVAEALPLLSANKDYAPLYFLQAVGLIANRDVQRIAHATAVVSVNDLTGFLDLSGGLNSAAQFTDLDLLAEWRSQAQSLLERLRRVLSKVSPPKASVTGKDGNLCINVETSEPATALIIHDKIENKDFNFREVASEDIEPAWELVDQGSILGTNDCASLTLSDMTSRYEVGPGGELFIWYRDVDGNKVLMTASLPVEEWSIVKDAAVTSLRHTSGLSFDRDEAGMLSVRVPHAAKVAKPSGDLRFGLRLKASELDPSRQEAAYQSMFFWQMLEMAYDAASGEFRSTPVSVEEVSRHIRDFDGGVYEKSTGFSDSMNVAMLLDALVHAGSAEIKVRPIGSDIAKGEAEVGDVATAASGFGPGEMAELLGTK